MITDIFGEIGVELTTSPEKALAMSLGVIQEKRLSNDAKILLGVLVAAHCEEIMQDEWLAHEVLRAVFRRYKHKHRHKKTPFGTDRDLTHIPTPARIANSFWM